MADQFQVSHLGNFQSPIVGVDMGTASLMETQSCLEIDQTEPLMDLDHCMARNTLEGPSHCKESTATEVAAFLEPCAGMEFESEDAAYSFYNEYARCAGFGVTRRSSRRSRTNRAFIAGQYVCSRHGFKKSNGKNSARSILRVGCKAMMKVKKMDSGKWVILDIIKEHNHELNPENICLFRSHKELKPPKRSPMKCRRAYMMEHRGHEESEGGATKSIGSHGERDDVEENSFMAESIVEGDGNSDPYIGMEFESEEAAYLFYNRYARRVGFGVTRRSSRRSKTNKSFIAGQYVCSRHRFKRRNEKTNNPQLIAWVSCKAMLKVKKMESGKWVIVDFVKEHNHEVHPENVFFFRSHKQFLSSTMNSIGAKRTSGVRSNKMFPILSKQCGGICSVSYSEEGCQTPVDKEKGKSLTLKDAEIIYDYFIRMQHSNPTFFYAMELDEGQRFRSVFWVDAKSRMAYTHFDDAVTFDTSYVMNKYRVPFVSFTGVNNHGQSLLFGSALLADVTTRSIVWVFKAWLTAMSGRSPMVIMTDHEKAMKEAVSEVFPNVFHCFSLTQISKKAPKKLAHACTVHENFMNDLSECIFGSTTDCEFETRWKELLDCFNLKEDEWLQSLYEDRQFWVPAFVKDKFLARMFSAQQNENLCSFLDAYVNSETTVKEFLGKYDEALQNKREEEARADFETYYTKPLLKTPSPFETQLASVYTREIFKKFQVEVSGIAACHIISFQQEGTSTSYMVKDLEAMKDYTVKWNISETKVSCICQLFEFRGFLCRHAMTALVASSIYKIPSHYILARWTKDAKNRKNLDHGCTPVQSDGPESTVLRFNDLCKQSIKFAEEGSLCKETYNVALAALQEALEKVVNKNDSLGRIAQQRAVSSNGYYKVNEGNEEYSAVEIPVMVDPWRTYQLGLGDGS
ncbi:protein FAR1-RELATED SEQUENCE 4-like [Aristolochia californica]|uniref:protein FAR1-RELATED SEQUENCE 4-like n=1 Tax=Aristolochia californica TaxID=171875 RepID=UPI0035E07E2E